MDEKKQRIIETIQKILIHAKDQEGKPEGNAFKQKATKMMAQYRIEETEIDLNGEDSFILDTFEFYNDGNKCPQWPEQLVNMFCYAFDCKTVFRTYHDRIEWEIIGTFHDVETVIYFIECVSTHIDKAGWKTWPDKKNRKKRNQLGNTAASIIWTRIYELKQQMDQTINEDDGNRALVVQKTTEVNEALKELYPKTKTKRRSKIDMAEDSKTIDAGTIAGKTAPLNFAIDE